MDHPLVHKFLTALLLGAFVLGLTLSGASSPAFAANQGSVGSNLDLCGAGAGTGKIRGTVTRASDGAPLAGIRVSALTLYENDPAWDKSAVTDSAGDYEISGLTGGAWVVRADPNIYNALHPGDPSLLRQIFSGHSSLATYTPVLVVEGDTTEDINFSLAAGGTIKGRITNQSSGLPMAGAVSIHRANVQSPPLFFEEVDLADNGYYTSTFGLLPGDYKVSFYSYTDAMETVFYPATTDFAAAGVITIAGVETRTANMAISVPAPQPDPPTGTIRGKVSLPGALNPRDVVLVRAFVNDELFASGEGGAPDATGNYTLTIPAGNARIVAQPWLGTELGPNPRAYVRLFYDGKFTHDEAAVVSVAAGATVNNINFALVPGGRISGRVTFDDGAGGGAGKRAIVSAFSGARVDNFTQSASTETDAQGNFNLPALAPGEYTITARPLAATDRCLYAPQTYASKVQIVGDANVPDINFTLVYGAHIVGRITAEATGAGVASPVRGLRPGDSDLSVEILTTAAQTGHYRLGPLLPGAYSLYVTPGASLGFGWVFYKDQAARAAAQTISVSGAAVVLNIDQSLRPGAAGPGDPGTPTRQYLPFVLR